MVLPLLIQPEQLEKILAAGSHEYLILDTSSPANYEKHHIPGAVHIAPKLLQCGTPPTPGKIPSNEQLTALFSSVGLHPDKHVIVYDDEGGGWAGRLIWTLDVLGHQHYSYVDGGLRAWAEEGHPLESQINRGIATDYIVSIDRQPIAEIEDIISNLGSENFAIWDARSAEEYQGEKVLAKNGGHIPGAVNIDWLELMDPESNLRLVDLEKLQQRLNATGLTKDKHIVTHCQTHHRSGLTYLAMKILGYTTIKGYHGSWSEWGNLDNTPITNPTLDEA
ncbi:MAG: rhodanese-like domain-containing protein [Oceanicoccus sp.]